NWYQLAKQIEAAYPVKVCRRMKEDIPLITDNGNYILDIEMTSQIDPYAFHEYLIHLTGVLETGYFLDVADEAIVGTESGVKFLTK
ncbi:ribose-5-phosphate isomerase A, partial [Staphylococcus hyicus]